MHQKLYFLVCFAQGPHTLTPILPFYLILLPLDQNPERNPDAVKCPSFASTSYTPLIGLVVK